MELPAADRNDFPVHHGVSGFQLEFALQLETRWILATLGPTNRWIYSSCLSVVGSRRYSHTNLPLSQQGSTGHSGCKFDLVTLRLVMLTILFFPAI